MTSDGRSHEECTFSTPDGIELFYRHWPATSGPPRGGIVMFHRGHEHSGRMAHLVEELDLPDFAFFAWDARGHGRSPGARGFSPSVAVSVSDVEQFVDHISSAHGIGEPDLAVVAQSVGAVLVATWAHDYAPGIRGMVLASPAFEVKLYVPFARAGLRLLHAVRGNFFVNSYVKAKFLTHDEERIDSYENDPLVTRPISVNVLLGLYEAAERVVADAQAIGIPTQLLISGSDWVVHRGPQDEFFERLGAGTKERHVLPGFYHDTLGERDRVPVVQKIRDFVLGLFEQPLERPGLLDAHLEGATKAEADRLAKRLPWWTPRGLYWAMTRAGLKVGGWISDGIALGHETGFDSGSTLDYVYRNRASGAPLIGRLVDRVYLDAIGWRGIRERKRNLESTLRRTLDRLASEGERARILDVAAGHGRYVLEAIADQPHEPKSVLLRDYSETNVEQGRQLIASMGLERIAAFESGDAFDRESLASVRPRPNIGIVSGLYELFPDNELVRRSLDGLAEAIAPGGYLIYTGQPWHPQLEMIARALTSHRGGAAWVMRRRTQAEMDQLVAAAGFSKLEQRIDEWGIFTVSLAQRVE